MTVDLDPQLLQILACPAPHHAPLRVGTPAEPNANALTCTACGRVFPVTDGIPVLLLDEASPPTVDLDDVDDTAGDVVEGTAGGTVRTDKLDAEDGE